jgi:hypothetical protein
LSYILERSPDLSATPAFTPLASNIPSRPPITTYTNQDAAAGPLLFYRVGAQ